MIIYLKTNIHSSFYTLKFFSINNKVENNINVSIKIYNKHIDTIGLPIELLHDDSEEETNDNNIFVIKKNNFFKKTV